MGNTSQRAENMIGIADDVKMYQCIRLITVMLKLFTIISWLRFSVRFHHCLVPFTWDIPFRASSVLLFPTFWGLSYFFLLLGKIPTFSYFFRFLLKLIDKNAIFKPKNFFSLASLGIISLNK